MKSNRAWLYLPMAILCIATGVAIGTGMLTVDLDRPIFTESHFLFSLIFILLAAWILFHDVRHPEWDLLEPGRLFLGVWFTTLSISLLRLSTFERAFTPRLLLVVIGGIGSFYVGVRLAYAIWPKSSWRKLKELRKKVQPDWSPSIALGGVVALFTLTAGAFIYTFYHFGNVPLLSGNVEWARNNFAVNSYVQRISLTIAVVAPLALSYLLKFRRYAIPLLGIWCAAILFFILSASSYFPLYIVLVSFVLYRYTAPKLDWRRLFTVILLLLLAKTAVDTFRFIRSGYYSNLTADQNFPKPLLPFANDYFYVVMNLQTLQHLSESVPGVIPYTHGYYLSYPIRAPFESAKPGVGKGKLSDILWAPTEQWYGFNSVTVSCFGEALVDFGLAGVWLWSLAFGFCAAATYSRLRRRPSWLTLFWMSQFAVAIAVSFFSNLFALFDVYWAIAIATIFNAVVHRNKVQAHITRSIPEWGHSMTAEP